MYLHCIYKIQLGVYNKYMNEIKYYELHTVNGLTFRFKLDINPVTNEYEPHIWQRHQIEPEQVVNAYLNLTYTNWNIKNNRFEGYSITDDLNIYYNFYSKDKTKIMVITAFKI